MLIENWRQAWRWSSVRVSVLGAAVWATLLAYPEAGLEIWNALPDAVVALLPERAASLVPLVFYLLIIAARVTKLGGDDDGDA